MANVSWFRGANVGSGIGIISKLLAVDIPWLASINTELFQVVVVVLEEMIF